MAAKKKPTAKSTAKAKASTGRASAGARKSAAIKAAARTTKTAKKPAAKPAAKKVPAKTAPKKAPAAKATTARKPAPKKPTAKKPTAKKPVTKTAAARTTAAKPAVKPVARTAPARKKSVIAAKTAKAPVKKSPAPEKAAAPAKPTLQRGNFRVNEHIVYPAHGVGRITLIETQEIAGISLELFVINFAQEKMTLRVPTSKATAVGMRKLSDEATIRKALHVLKGRARIKRTMWSRRAQEYDAKINSGNIILIAEVVRDLFRAETQPEQSYSERQLYEAALDRLSREVAAVEKLDDQNAVQKVVEVLSKTAKAARKAAEEAAAAAAENDAEEAA